MLKFLNPLYCPSTAGFIFSPTMESFLIVLSIWLKIEFFERSPDWWDHTLWFQDEPGGRSCCLATWFEFSSRRYWLKVLLLNFRWFYGLFVWNICCWLLYCFLARMFFFLFAFVSRMVFWMKMSSFWPSSLMNGYISLWCLFLRYASSFFKLRTATCELRVPMWLVVRGIESFGCAEGDTTYSIGAWPAYPFPKFCPAASFCVLFLSICSIYLISL